MKKIERIVLLTPGFAADENDHAATTYLQDLVASYRKYFPEVEVLVIAFQYPFKRGNYTWNGVKVFSAGGRNSGLPWRLFTWRRVLKKLDEIHAEKRIDLVQSFWLTEAALVGQKFCRKRKVPQVASILGQDVVPANRYLSRLHLEKICAVAISGFLAKQFKELSGKEVNAVIPFGIDTAKLVRPSKEERPYDLIGAGALIPLKNYSLFIELVAELRETFPAIRSCIIGKGPQMEMLEQKITSLGLEGHVELKGEVPHNEVFQWMCRSKLFLHTSSYEGQSLVMSEALYAGLPVVCFDTGRPYDGEGMQVCQDRMEMTEKIRGLLAAPMEHRPLLVQGVEQTAREYFDLYSRCR